jgi:hypothetical protein
MTKSPTSETQTGLEELFSKHQLMPVLREQFSEVGDECEVADPKFTTEVLVQIYLHRQADVITMVGILSPKFGTPQEVADNLLILCEHDYIDYQETSSKFTVKYDISDDIKEMLAKYQYPLPMVVKPNKVLDNFGSGYNTISRSVILNGSAYFNDVDLCLDHLNRANSVALSLSQDTIYSEQGMYLRPTRKSGEDFTDFRKRQKQSDVFYTTTVDVMGYITQLSDECYLTHRYDRRGRCYSSGYHVNTQGTDFNKAVLEFAKKEMIV